MSPFTGHYIIVFIKDGKNGKIEKDVMTDTNVQIQIDGFLTLFGAKMIANELELTIGIGSSATLEIHDKKTSYLKIEEFFCDEESGEKELKNCLF